MYSHIATFVKGLEQTKKSNLLVAKNSGMSYGDGMYHKKASPVATTESDSSADERRREQTFVLAHFSDPHLSTLSGVAASRLLNKRLLGYLSWYRRRRHVHSPRILEALLADLADTAPDHIVVTGDLTHLGLPEEFDQVARWLTHVGPPDKVTVVPGNHDTYVVEPWQRTFAAWAPYLAGDDGACAAPRPSLRIRGHVALIGLSSARPSAPFLAVGTLGRRQLACLENILEQTGRRGLLRVVLLHHPPVAGSIAWRKRLTDAGPFAEILARQGAELILHGHAHRALTRELAAGGRKIPVIGVPSASEAGDRPRRNARYHLYSLAKSPGAWTLRISMRAWCPGNRKFLAAGDRTMVIPA
jgi:3',5'-cyclic AMP phosphodiesterase CpdA